MAAIAILTSENRCDENRCVAIPQVVYSWNSREQDSVTPRTAGQREPLSFRWSKLNRLPAVLNAIMPCRARESARTAPLMRLWRLVGRNVICVIYQSGRDTNTGGFIINALCASLYRISKPLGMRMSRNTKCRTVIRLRVWDSTLSSVGDVWLPSEVTID